MVKGFDKDFGILGEETDLSWRVWLYGYKVLFEPMATGYHAFNTKFKPAQDYYTSERVQFNGCRNYITMLIKNLETRNLVRILPIHVLIWTTAGLAMIITGKLKQGVNILRGLIYVCRNIREILTKRERVQQNRHVTDAEIWPSIYRTPPRGYTWRRFCRYLSIGLHG
jgi:GT2 family glycosyltransferase